jgi:peptide deformylase
LDDAVTTLAENMLETMQKANGIGLAANQVGSLQRIIVVDISGMEEAEDVPAMVMLNPVVFQENDRWIMEEGCLSIPDIREEVERAEKIKVRFRNLAFEEKEIEVDGLLGRVILHEIDHLDGVLFVDRIGSVKRKLLHGRLNKLRRGDFEVSYPIVSNEVPANTGVPSQ